MPAKKQRPAGLLKRWAGQGTSSNKRTRGDLFESHVELIKEMLTTIDDVKNVIQTKITAKTLDGHRYEDVKRVKACRLELHNLQY